MSKLKSFQQFLIEKDRAQEIEQDIINKGTPNVKNAEEVEDEAEELQEAEIVIDATNPKSKDLKKLLKKNNVTMEIVNQKGSSGFPEVKLTGSKEDLTTVLADDEYGWDDADLAEYIKEAQDIEDAKKTRAVSEMLAEIYENYCKNEAKAYEEDEHDEHTAESYMKENAALVGGLSAKTLREMKEEFTIEAYEAACNEMIEAYSKKINEMKEMNNSADAEDME